MEFEIMLSGLAPQLYPTETFFALLENGPEESMELPKEYPFSGEWGISNSIWVNDAETYPIPFAIDMVWLSIAEKNFYSIDQPLPKEKLESFFSQKDETNGQQLFNCILLGMAPYGKLAIWVSGEKKSVLVKWLEGEPIDVDMEDFLPENPNASLANYCDFYINNDSRVKENLETNGLPPHDLFDNYMKQFTYRYLPLFEHWDKDEEKWRKYEEDELDKQPQLDYIEEALYDGTHDKLHDDGLLNYHEAGKPKKLAVKWHIKKSEYTAYFWFDDEAIRSVFDKFYGIHPETKTDFIIHIDHTEKKYQLALYRYGLKEPLPLPEETYQLIVFKNKFEHFRSNNYDQPRGSWIW